MGSHDELTLFGLKDLIVESCKEISELDVEILKADARRNSITIPWYKEFYEKIDKIHGLIKALPSAQIQATIEYLHSEVFELTDLIESCPVGDILGRQSLIDRKKQVEVELQELEESAYE